MLRLTGSERQKDGYAVIRYLTKPVALSDCVRLLGESCAPIIVTILMLLVTDRRPGMNARRVAIRGIAWGLELLAVSQAAQGECIRAAQLRGFGRIARKCGLSVTTCLQTDS